MAHRSRKTPSEFRPNNKRTVTPSVQLQKSATSVGTGKPKETVKDQLRLTIDLYNSGVMIDDPFQSGPLRSVKTLRIYNHDLDKGDLLQLGEILYIDTETDGLDFRRDKLRLVTVMDQNNNIVMIRNPDHNSSRLHTLIEWHADECFLHHAPFDFKHLLWWTKITLPIDRTHCSKIMGKIIRPKESTSLYKVIPTITKQNPYKEKSTTLSNWNAKELDAEQITYACTDVFFLPRITKKLMTEITNAEKESVYIRAVDTALGKALLETEGYEDTLSYEGQPNERLRQLWIKRRKAMRL